MGARAQEHAEIHLSGAPFQHRWPGGVLSNGGGTLEPVLDQSLIGARASAGASTSRRHTGNLIVLYYTLKVVVSALLIVAIAEIAKRSTGFAALVASLPVTSLLAFVWLHFEAVPPDRIAALSSQIFWLVLPSLVLFLLLPLLLRQGLNFWLSLGFSVAATAACYLALLFALRRAGVAL